MFFVWADRADVEDVEFYACTAYDCSTHGFNMNQDFSDRVPRTIRATRFIDCYAALCGYGEAGGSRSPWITGFDLQESQDLVDCRVVNCIAESNWESGFHFEPGARLDASGREIGPRTRCEGLVLEGCIAKNNGWRNTDPARFFMSGFYVHRNANLTDCSSVHNRNAGFSVQGGEKLRFDGCSDRDSTYGWLIVKSSHGVALAGCRSDQAAHLGALGRVREPPCGHGLHADRRRAPPAGSSPCSAGTRTTPGTAARSRTPRSRSRPRGRRARP